MSAQHLTGNAIHQKMLYANPNPVPQIAPPSLRGNLCSETSDLFFSINFGWREREKKKGAELCIRKAGTRTWILMQRGSDTSSVAVLDSLLPRCYRRKKERKKTFRTKNFFSPRTYFHSWMVRIAGQLHSDCTHKIKNKYITDTFQHSDLDAM